MAGLSEEQREKKAQGALYLMLGIDLCSFALFWAVQSLLHNARVAFALLVLGLCAGAGYFIYQSYKLRPNRKATEP